MKRTILCVLLSLPLVAQTKTTITDTLALPGGGFFQGTITYDAPRMTCGATTYAAERQTITVTAGAVNLQLPPNDACTVLTGQINAYRITYAPTGGVRSYAYWLVPTSATPVRVNQIQTAGTPLPQPLTYLLQSVAPSGAVAGQIPQFNGTTWVPATVSGTGDMTGPPSSIDGEVALFSQTTGKALKRATQSGVARLVNGVLGTVAGANSDCVHVDGTSGACGSGGSGAVNTVFGRQGDVGALGTDYASYYSPLGHLHSGTYEPVDATLLRSSGSFVNPTWIASLAWSKITGTPSAYAPSAHASLHATTGTDPLSPVSIGAVSLTGSYANPSWITSLDALKVLPSPTGNPLKVLQVNSLGTGYELGTVGLGVTSFATRQGSVTPLAGDYSAFYEALGHVHLISGVTGLQAALDDKAGLVHGHVPGDITGPGVFAAARLGTGTPDGYKFLRDDQVWAVPAGGGGGAWAVQSFPTSFTAQTSVTLSHNFNSLNQIARCRDSGGATVEPNGFTRGLSSSTVTFSVAQTGSCVVFGGTGLYGQSFTSQTSVALAHGLNTTNVIADCYDASNNLIKPNSDTVTDANTVTVTFTVAQTGGCVVLGSLAGGGGGGGGGGTVTSVGISGTGDLIVSGSPVTTTGTMALSWAAQAAAKFLASPAGASGTPSFRTLAVSDYPTMVGDSGSGGTKGAVPAPAAGDAALGKVFHADGTWKTVSASANVSGGVGIVTSGAGPTVISIDTAVVARKLAVTFGYDFPSVSTNSCQYTDITIPGAANGMPVAMGNNGNTTDGTAFPVGITMAAQTINPNTVRAQVCNTGVAAFDPHYALTYTVILFQ